MFSSNFQNRVREGPQKLQEQNGGSLVILKPKIQRRLVFSQEIEKEFRRQE